MSVQEGSREYYAAESKIRGEIDARSLTRLLNAQNTEDLQAFLAVLREHPCELRKLVRGQHGQFFQKTGHANPLSAHGLLEKPGWHPALEAVHEILRMAESTRDSCIFDIAIREIRAVPNRILGRREQARRDVAGVEKKADLHVYAHAF
ncbi:MAG: hypothetical protein Q8R32_02075 [bacterium]|nr:hypothetical protein [bacterium]